MAEVVVRALSPGLLKDWLGFFDHEAFRDNPRWASCYCHFYLADHSAKDWGERTGPENRAASSALISAGRLRGYLAYDGEKPIGWCNAAPRSALPNLQKEEALAVEDISQVGSIVCFIVAQPFRRGGVARRLLDAACDGFRAEGLAVAEAYPRSDATADAANYHGPLSMYLEAGFRIFRETDGTLIVRKALLEPDSG